MRSIALHCCSCVLSVLFVRPASGSESTPLPLPTGDQDALSMGYGLWRVLIALGVVICLIFLIRWVVKRGNGPLSVLGGGEKSIEILERKPLGPRQALLLVRVREKGVLLHQAKNTLTPLCEIDLEESPQT